MTQAASFADPACEHCQGTGRIAYNGVEDFCVCAKQRAAESMRASQDAAFDTRIQAAVRAALIEALHTVSATPKPSPPDA